MNTLTLLRRDQLQVQRILSATGTISPANPIQKGQILCGPYGYCKVRSLREGWVRLSLCKADGSPCPSGLFIEWVRTSSVQSPMYFIHQQPLPGFWAKLAGALAPRLWGMVAEGGGVGR